MREHIGERERAAIVGPERDAAAVEREAEAFGGGCGDQLADVAQQGPAAEIKLVEAALEIADGGVEGGVAQHEAVGACAAGERGAAGGGDQHIGAVAAQKRLAAGHAGEDVGARRAGDGGARGGGGDHRAIRVETPLKDAEALFRFAPDIEEQAAADVDQFEGRDIGETGGQGILERGKGLQGAIGKKPKEGDPVIPASGCDEGLCADGERVEGGDRLKAGVAAVENMVGKGELAFGGEVQDGEAGGARGGGDHEGLAAALGDGQIGEGGNGKAFAAGEAVGLAEALAGGVVAQHCQPGAAGVDADQMGLAARDRLRQAMAALKGCVGAGECHHRGAVRIIGRDAPALGREHEERCGGVGLRGEMHLAAEAAGQGERIGPPDSTGQVGAPACKPAAAGDADQKGGGAAQRGHRHIGFGAQAMANRDRRRCQGRQAA